MTHEDRHIRWKLPFGIAIFLAAARNLYMIKYKGVPRSRGNERDDIDWYNVFRYLINTQSYNPFGN